MHLGAFLDILEAVECALVLGKNGNFIGVCKMSAHPLLRQGASLHCIVITVTMNIIIVDTSFLPLVMFNPVITKKTGRYETEEGCLSLIGVRPCSRYKEITVEYQDMNFKKHTKTFKDWTAQIIQHDACVIIGPKVRKVA